MQYGRQSEVEPLHVKLLARPIDALRILHHMQRCHYDVVFVQAAHDYRGLLREVPIVFGASLLVQPIFYLFHGTPERWGRSLSERLWQLLFGMVVQRSTGVFVLAGQQLDVMRQRYPRVPVTLTRYPFSVRSKPVRVHPAADVEPALIFVGRAIPAKGLLDLIAALPAVIEQAPCRLVVCGDGPSLPEARRRVREAGLEDRVQFRGWLDAGATHAALEHADIFVLPTWHPEGFPVAVLESMAAGLPIVTTRAGGMPAILREGEHVLFVPPRDPRALVQALARLLKDPPLRARLGCANYELVRDFAPAQVMADAVAFMRSTLAARRR